MSRARDIAPLSPFERVQLSVLLSTPTPLARAVHDAYPPALRPRQLPGTAAPGPKAMHRAAAWLGRAARVLAGRT